MKKVIKNPLITFILGAVIFSTITVFADAILANNVSFTPDYFLLFDSEENIISRWFVIEEKRNREGQWIYSLRRDVIADNLESLLTAPIFVHKGMLKENDTFIGNTRRVSSMVVFG